MDATVTLVDGMAFRAVGPSGHAIMLDAVPEAGGQGNGAGPLELVLLGLGGCTGMDVISMLRKMRQDVTGYEVRLESVRATEHPKVFTSIVVEHVVRGRGLNPGSVRRAVELSATQYCPVAAMLGKTVAITPRYRVIDEDAGTEVTGDLLTEPE